jgi:hypothetical protein
MLWLKTELRNRQLQVTNRREVKYIIFLSVLKDYIIDFKICYENFMNSQNRMCLVRFIP